MRKAFSMGPAGPRALRRRAWAAPLAAAVLLLAGACDRPEEPVPPADVLAQPQLVTLLADLQVLEARVEASRLAPDSARALFLSQKQELLWRRQVSDSAFQRSYRYYAIHGKDLEQIYQAVIDTLSEREKRLGGKGGEPPAWRK